MYTFKTSFFALCAVSFVLGGSIFASQTPNLLDLTLNVDDSIARKQTFIPGFPFVGGGRVGPMNARMAYNHGTSGSMLRQALLAGDYTQFIGLLSSGRKSTTTKHLPSQEKFDLMSKRARKNEALRQALESNNYPAFISALSPSQAEFASMAEYYQTQTKIYRALLARDYKAFLQASVNTPLADLSEEEFVKMSQRMSGAHTPKTHKKGLTKGNKSLKKGMKTHYQYMKRS